MGRTRDPLGARTGRAAAARSPRASVRDSRRRRPRRPRAPRDRRPRAPRRGLRADRSSRRRPRRPGRRPRRRRPARRRRRAPRTRARARAARRGTCGRRLRSEGPVSADSLRRWAAGAVLFKGRTKATVEGVESSSLGPGYASPPNSRLSSAWRTAVQGAPYLRRLSSSARDEDGRRDDFCGGWRPSPRNKKSQDRRATISTRPAGTGAPRPGPAPTRRFPRTRPRRRPAPSSAAAPRPARPPRRARALGAARTPRTCGRAAGLG